MNRTAAIGQQRALSDFTLLPPNQALGFQADERNFALPVAILRALGVPRVRLLSNNPAKVRALMWGGIEVTARVPCERLLTTHSIAYLETKRDKLGDSLQLPFSHP